MYTCHRQKRVHAQLKGRCLYTTRTLFGVARYVQSSLSKRRTHSPQRLQPACTFSDVARYVQSSLSKGGMLLTEIAACMQHAHSVTYLRMHNRHCQKGGHARCLYTACTLCDVARYVHSSLAKRATRSAQRSLFVYNVHTMASLPMYSHHCQKGVHAPHKDCCLHAHCVT